MKKLFKFLIFLAVFFVIAIVAANYFTNDLSTTADNFFKAIKNNDYNKATQYLSEDFKRTTNLSQLKEVFPQSRFKNYESCSFLAKVANMDGTGKLKGKVKFSNGSAIPIKIYLVKENKKWKINHIILPRSGVSQTEQQEPNQPQLPQINYTKLVKETMVKLGKAIATANYSDFYSYAASQFRQSVSLDKLQNSFNQFRQAPINWENVGNLDPIIQKKELQQNGIMKLIGYFPSHPYKVGFDFEYYKNNN
jgi:uncharacterized membrane protein